MSTPSQLKEKLVTLFGGSGFLGTYVAQALLERGARVRIASRNPEKSFSLKPLANLGQLQFARCDITNEANLAACVDSADAVINLVGAFSGNLKRVMGEAPGEMARLAKAQGASAFVHVSAIGADPESPTAYASTKAAGETKVSEAFPKATVIRPSIIFGKDDNFLNMFGQLIATAPILPVFGPDAKLQLAYVDDIAEAIVRAAEDPSSHGGKTFELGGPEVLTMMEINQRIAAAQGRSPTLLAMPDTASAIFAALPLTPMSSDQWTLLKAGSVASPDMPGFKQLGIEPKPLGLFLDKWMVRFRKHGRFGVPSPLES